MYALRIRKGKSVHKVEQHQSTARMLINSEHNVMTQNSKLKPKHISNLALPFYVNYI